MMLKIIEIDNKASYSEYKYLIYELFYNNASNFDIYSDFLNWLLKVENELDSKFRHIVIAITDDKVVGICISKNDSIERKICTLFVQEDYRNKGIAKKMMDKSLNWFNCPSATLPIITVPCNLTITCRSSINYFLVKKYNFKFSGIIESNGIICELFNTVNNNSTALISIKPKYSKKILSGDKLVEFRRKKVNNKVKRFIIYSTSPERKIVGYFTVKCIDVDSVDNLWKKYEKIGGIDKKSLYRYFITNDSKYKSSFCIIDKGVAILIDKVYKLDIPLDPTEVIENYKSPQFYKYV